ncbi:MAG: ribonuclease D [Alphaproteobacteria bacterium]|nr:ribonuclease D [Alphaproteobacteria bacterium]
MIITDQKTLDSFCEGLKGLEFITVDTEFLREKTYYPKLCLIQISGPDGKAAAIDPLATGLDLAPVYALLFDPAILKVFHAARQDLEIFFNLTGRVVLPIFDTQVAAMVCGYGDSVGYEALVRNITGQQLDKSVQFTNWSLRPLSERQIHYALGDVTHLIEVYHRLAAELEKRGRTSWVLQEEEILADPNTYQNDPQEAWRRIKIKTPKAKSLAVLRALAAWREEQAQSRDIPKGWILRDETLAEIAGQVPTAHAQLVKVRGLSEDMVKNRIGDTLLKLIADTLKADPKTWPQPVRKTQPSPSVAATVDILRMLLKVQCAEAGVATKLLGSSEDLEDLAAHENPNNPLLKGWRYELFGREALALKNGELAIGLKNSKIMKYKVSGETDTHS